MILRSLQIAGFGRLTGRRFDFAPGLNVVYGPNESGKSTLANAIVATLYGVERRKETWRPWTSGAFGATLIYSLADGEQIEVQRDFERDAKGLHVYDRAGNEISAKLGAKTGPGEAHLGVPLDVFLNAACVKQQEIAIDEGKHAGPIAAHLARALDGGPREDAALGAIARLDDAIRTHVGTERARKNAPLRALRTLAAEQQAAVEEARGRLATLDELRDRAERAAHERERLTVAAAEAERRLRALRAGAIAKRLANLHDFRAELAELQAHRAGYADVADFPAERAAGIDAAFYAWESACEAAFAAQTEADAALLRADERAELERRRRDAGSIDDATFEALAAANARAAAARSAATAAARDAAAARLAGEPGSATRRLLPGAAIALLCIAVGFAIAHSWTWTGAAALIALIAGGAVLVSRREAAQRAREAQAKQQAADEALAAETAAANAVSAVLDPLGIERFEELTLRRSRLGELLGRKREAERTFERARSLRFAADTAAAKFDRLAETVVPAAAGDRAARRAAANALAARRRERDGVDAHLHALEMRRSTILGSDDEFALEAELGELQRDGVEPADDDAPGALRAAENEQRAVADQLRVARDAVARLGGELSSLQTQAADLAELDERLARTHADIGRLETFERSVTLAKTILEQRTREAHQAFARRLEDYAATTLDTITGGRYAEIFVDPATLAIRVRVPETQAIEDLDAVSAGTRDQTYLVVRFAMARMFAEGIETPPLLLDDPFAYWDATRIERCLPILEHVARDAQVMLFTSSSELADSAARRGAYRLDLSEPILV